MIAAHGIAASVPRGPRPRRTQPRGGELALMRSLLSGPRPLSAGPVGRCTKHGWLRVSFDDDGSRAAARAVARYELTDAGRAAIEDAPAGTPQA